MIYENSEPMTVTLNMILTIEMGDYVRYPTANGMEAAMQTDEMGSRRQNSGEGKQRNEAQIRTT
jgi:hypothetical protein